MTTKWRSEGDDAIELVRLFASGELTEKIKDYKEFLATNQSFAARYGASATKGYRNLRINYLNLWKRYQHWRKTRTGKFIVWFCAVSAFLLLLSL
jgi:hypothetical protein